MIINILKSMLAENDFVNHSLNQIFRWIFADAKVENRILIRKFIFQCSWYCKNDYLCKDTETIGQPDQSWEIAD